MNIKITSKGRLHSGVNNPMISKAGCSIELYSGGKLNYKVLDPVKKNIHRRNNDVISFTKEMLI